MDTFNPEHLTPAASLNRMPLVAATGISLPEDVQGKRAYELLSREALIRELLDDAPSLGLDVGDEALLPYRFRGCFRAGDEHVLQLARRIAHRWGRRLATLALLLKRGDEAQRTARPEWNASYWEHWASINHIWFGGGLMEGPFGREVAQAAQTYLQDADVHDFSLAVAQHPGHLPLIGAARSVPSDAPDALVFDFGGTAVKRAVPTFAAERLVGLRLLPSVPVALLLANAEVQYDLAAARHVIAETIAATVDTVTPHSSRLHVMVSISAYIAHNRTLPGQGGQYSKLTEGIDDMPLWFTDYIKQSTGTSVTIDFVHDGTAAARTYAGIGRGAVIMVGTALGSGFPPPANALRPMASTIELVSG